MVSILDAHFYREFRAVDTRPAWQWAMENIKVGNWSPWPGGMISFEQTPWLKSPLECKSRKTCHELTMIGPAAGGKSTVMEVYLSYIIANDPGYTLWVSQTDETAGTFAETRIMPFVEACPAVARLFPADRHKKRNTSIIFPHMAFEVVPANKTQAQSKHIRYLLMDETWLYDPGIMGEFEKRTTKFSHNRFIIRAATGSLAGDETDEAFQNGTRREWQFRCPECGGLHIPRWNMDRADTPGGVRWDGAAKGPDGQWDKRKVEASVIYQCPLCSAQFKPTDENGYKLNRGGEYAAAAGDSTESRESFHWNAIASDFKMLTNFVLEYLSAKRALKNGDSSLLQEFFQKRLALAWEDKQDEAEYIMAPGGYNKGDPWPDEAVRLMAVDVQLRSFWVVIRSWGNGPQSRLIWEGQLETWANVHALQIEMGVQDRFVWVDAAHFTDLVYQECCHYGWVAIRGEEGKGGFLVESRLGNKVRLPAVKSVGPCRPSRILEGSKLSACTLMRIAEGMTSDALDQYRRGNCPWWTVAADVSKDYKEQMAARVRRSVVDKSGRKIQKWVTIGSCGEHLWDCERIQIAAAHVIGLLSPAIEPTTEKENEETK